MIELNDLISRLDGDTIIEVNDMGENSVKGCLDDVADEVFRKFPNAKVDGMFIDYERGLGNAVLIINVSPIERRKR